VKYALRIFLLGFDRGSFQFVPQPSFFFVYILTFPLFINFIEHDVLKDDAISRFSIYPEGGRSSLLRNSDISVLVYMASHSRMK
jgi:hypothetical protein